MSKKLNVLLALSLIIILRLLSDLGWISSVWWDNPVAIVWSLAPIAILFAIAVYLYRKGFYFGLILGGGAFFLSYIVGFVCDMPNLFGKSVFCVSAHQYFDFPFLALSFGLLAGLLVDATFYMLKRQN